jgi:23S rRNA (cytidine1920-2'-O)/16S rRNA (cytidine1409-2'-O)-methyltransferase
MEKKRLDVVLEEKGLAHSRSQAQRLIIAGSVRVNDQVVLKPSVKVQDADRIEVSQPARFVSRGGEKLLAAVEGFGFTNLTGKICVDVGASTGGFTDCLLQHGAEKVYAVDVGYGVLDWKIRNDPRVVVMEKTNARYVEGFMEPIDLVVVDASFISLRTLLPVIHKWFVHGHGAVIALIKTQFEAGRAETARGSGVIRDPEVHRNVLETILTFSQEEGFGVKGLIRSPLTGPKGNSEFLVQLELPMLHELDISSLVNAVLPQPDDPEPSNQPSASN